MKLLSDAHTPPIATAAIPCLKQRARRGRWGFEAWAFLGKPGRALYDALWEMAEL